MFSGLPTGGLSAATSEGEEMTRNCRPSATTRRATAEGGMGVESLARADGRPPRPRCVFLGEFYIGGA